MASNKRNTYVTAHNPETGESGTFGPDDDLPGWADKAITNKDVYETPKEDQAPVPGPSQGAEDLIGGGEEEEPKRTKASTSSTAK